MNLRITTLSIRNFRQFGKLDIPFAFHLNVFVGINGAGKSELEGLAPKQLLIFDCCRLVEGLVLENRFSARHLVKTACALDVLYRMRFNQLLQVAAPQHLKLYFCRKGQCSIATGRGSLYTQGLLRKYRLKKRMLLARVKSSFALSWQTGNKSRI